MFITVLFGAFQRRNNVKRKVIFCLFRAMFNKLVFSPFDAHSRGKERRKFFIRKAVRHPIRT